VIKALLIIGIVVAFLVGGLLGLRRSTRAGMPNAAVLERARRRNALLDAEHDGAADDEKQSPD
jgi:hypothetical protein